jgi:hypothetical protein
MKSIPQAKPSSKAPSKSKPKPRRSQKIHFFALVVPGSESILHVAERVLMDRIEARLKGVL